MNKESSLHIYNSNPDCNIIPKMHYMVHYPDWIVRLVKIDTHVHSNA